ncbi:TolC family protein [Petrocella sp. FN5]|uniref:TolC family protein n=1 Tax=Petrocella sp. FN5 TaxID=3032002 RepID=UPI0023DB54FC|nr:TolC family protein [Petrocella sp. FN5]MDF1618435.1 TolC family protein [Petrocella sp. FN5]
MNSKIIKKRVALTIASMLTLSTFMMSSVRAEELTAPPEEIPQAIAVEPIVLDIEDALQRALENSFELKIAEAEMNTSVMTASQQRTLAKEDATTGMYSADLAIKIAKVNREILPTLAKETYNAKITEVELGIKGAFAQLIFAKESLELAEKYKLQADESLAMVKTKRTLGQASDLEVTNTESEVATKASELTQAQITYNQNLMDLNLLMNEALEKTWVIEDTMATEAVELVPLEDMKAYMLENHPMILGSNLSFSIAESTFELAKGYYPSNVWTYRYAEQDYLKAKYQNQLALLSQEKSLIQAYMSVQGNLEAIQALEKNVATVNESYRVAKIRFELGMITSFQLNEALLMQQRMESNLANAKRGYRLSIAQLEFISGMNAIKTTEEL